MRSASVEPAEAVTRTECAGGQALAERAQYPMPSSAAVSAVMRGNRKVDTSPELRLRSGLHRQGLRFRKNCRIDVAGLPVTPDIVFPGRRVAVFVDGCFWHSCPEHGTRPRSNEGYWSAKLARNRARDALVDQRLHDAGWRVIRVWEHVPPADAISLVASAVTTEGTERGHLR